MLNRNKYDNIMQGEKQGVTPYILVNRDVHLMFFFCFFVFFFLIDLCVVVFYGRHTFDTNYLMVRNVYIHVYETI